MTQNATPLEIYATGVTKFGVDKPPLNNGLEDLWIVDYIVNCQYYQSVYIIDHY